MPKGGSMACMQRLVMNFTRVLENWKLTLINPLIFSAFLHRFTGRVFLVRAAISIERTAKNLRTMVCAHQLSRQAIPFRCNFGPIPQARMRSDMTASKSSERLWRRCLHRCKKQCCAAYTVEIEHAGGTTSLDVDEGDTILETALEAGLELSHDCKMGVITTPTCRQQCSGVSFSDATTKLVARHVCGVHSERTGNCYSKRFLQHL